MWQKLNNRGVHPKTLSLVMQVQWINWLRHLLLLTNTTWYPKSSLHRYPWRFFPSLLIRCLPQQQKLRVHQRTHHANRAPYGETKTSVHRWLSIVTQARSIQQPQMNQYRYYVCLPLCPLFFPLQKEPDLKQNFKKTFAFASIKSTRGLRDFSRSKDLSANMAIVWSPVITHRIRNLQSK